jgi:hypothetical protein
MVIPPGKHFSISAGAIRAQPAGINKTNARRTALVLKLRPSSHQKLKKRSLPHIERGMNKQGTFTCLPLTLFT